MPDDVCQQVAAILGECPFLGETSQLFVIYFVIYFAIYLAYR